MTKKQKNKKKMSKALRIVTEEIQQAYPSNTFSNWHPFYADMNGNNPPCFVEFMKLMDCMNNKKVSECNSHYLKLLKCLHKQGFDDDQK